MGVPQDWESAAVYLHRGARSQRRSLRASFTEGTIPTSGVPESPQSNYIITMRLKVSVSENLSVRWQRSHWGLFVHIAGVVEQHSLLVE